MAYVVLYYSFMVLQLKARDAAVARAKSIPGSNPKIGMKSFGDEVANDPGARMGERTFLNMLEQQPTFLISLWLCAACVSSTLATILGWVAVLARALFPILWSRGPRGEWNLLVELSTQPYYLCVLGMLGPVLIWGVSGYNVVRDVPVWGVVLCVLGSFLGLFIVAILGGSLLHQATRGRYDQQPFTSINEVV